MVSNIFLLIADAVIGLCVLALFISILINFTEAKADDKRVKHEKKSIVETGSMTAFFAVFYLLIRFRIGELIVGGPVSLFLIVIGLLMVISGCIMNILGRFSLGSNWANQVKIYKDQTFVRSGVYSIVRHPLYSSIILMFYGACIVHSNYLAFLATTIVFIPFMYYRAKQEEYLLSKTFKGYNRYQREVGIFVPKIMRVKK